MQPSATFPTVFRQLLRTHQAFLSYAALHVTQLNLTLPQYDVIITLGNTTGLSAKTLGEQTLITKGTLTGVVNRLEEKGLVQRIASKTDGRSQIIRLTESGQAVYDNTFSEHLDFINKLFCNYAPEEVFTLEDALVRLHQAIIAARQALGESAEEESAE
jgi:MarR family transcriptional regulator, organic hydroperoxide resistance regulator